MYLLFSLEFNYAAVLFIFLAFTDALDGYLARKLNQVSDFGKFWDPLADKILVTSALIGLIEVRALSALPVIIIIGRDLLVDALRLTEASKGKIISASYLGKVKTVSQMAAILFLILNWPYATWIFYFAVAMTLISGVEYFARK